MLKKHRNLIGFQLLTILFALIFSCNAPESSIIGEIADSDSAFIAENYTKQEHYITMRDGVKLFTAVYSPKNTSVTYPILLKRTPYACKPYGEDKLPNSMGPSSEVLREKFIFVNQDVRGRFMSEGKFVDMTPHIADKKDDSDIDESTDTWDTVEFLIKNIPNNNQKVGIYGISYPGFYATAATADAHPSLVAALPKCPVSDWYFDDFHHHGTFFMPHFLNFFQYFGQERTELTQAWPEPLFEYDTKDGYEFYMNLGALSNVNEKLYHNKVAFWNDIVEHPNYDKYWQDRSILPNLSNVRPAVLVAGGWFDAEDAFGPLATYKAIEKNSPNAVNTLIMGPWRHGGMSRGSGSTLGNAYFGHSPAPSDYYATEVELPFFNYYLKGKGSLDLPEALVFETGGNKWQEFTEWPPKSAEEVNLYFDEDKLLSHTKQAGKISYNFVSDPHNPVPYTQEVSVKMTKNFMAEDQRFVADRPDVLTFTTNVLTTDFTVVGEILASLYVSTTAQDADWVVKVIDVFPDDFEGYEHMPKDFEPGGFQQLIRWETFRGRYRNSYQFPEPFVPSSVELVEFPLQDIMHTFKAGHKIMVQIHSSWFPIMDRNPQKWVDNIYKATDDDFVKATHSLHVSDAYPSRLTFRKIAL